MSRGKLSAIVLPVAFLCAVLASWQAWGVVTGGAGPGGFEPADGASDLALWLDAGDLDADGVPDGLVSGATVTSWADRSGYGRDANGVMGTPFYVASSVAANGRPAVGFSSAGGTDQLFTSYNFDSLGADYSVFAVSRYTGGDNERVVTSKTRNWLFGHHGGGDERWYAEGWIHQTGNGNTDLHVYTGIIGPSVNGNAGDPGADFWKDGDQLTDNDQGSNNTAYKPGGLALGAWTGGGESSNAEVAEVVIFNRALSEAERLVAQNSLSSKYDIGIGGEDLYAGDAPAAGDFDRDVFGVGRVDASSQLLDAGASGFGIEVAPTDDGDFALAGHNVASNSKVAIGGIAGVAERWSRAWYVDVTDANDNLAATLAFDYSDAGLARTTESDFTLLRSNDGGSTWSAVASTTAIVDDLVSFSVGAADLEDALYTLGDASNIPIVTTTPNPVFAELGGTRTTADGGVTVEDIDSPSLSGGSLEISMNFSAGDELAFTDQLGITGSYDGVTGVLTLAGSASVADYQAALQSIEYFNDDPGASLAPRTLTFTATDPDTNVGADTRLLVPVATAAADSVIWQGDVDSAWTGADNWTGDRVPDANDTAVFNDADSVRTTPDVTGSLLVGEVSLVNDSDRFTFSGTTLQTDRISQTGSGTNTVDSAIAQLTSFQGAVSDGRLEVTNLGNSSSLSAGTWNVAGGTLAAVTDGAATGLGNTDVVLSGGTLEILPGAAQTVNGIDETIFDAADTGLISNGNVTGDIENVRTAAAGPLGASDAQGILYGHLHYNDDGAVAARAAALGAPGFDAGNFTMLWTTTFHPTEDGRWDFRFNNNDDRASVWIDMDRNNAFSSGERIAVRTGCCAGASGFWDGFDSDLDYLIGIAMNDTGSGGYLRDMEFKAPSGDWTDFDPSANPGLFTTSGVPVAAADNDVQVTADSAIHLASTLPAATLGNLTMDADTQLTVHSADGGQPLEFTGRTTLSGGTATLNTTGGAKLTLNQVGETVATDLVKTGDGTLLLPTPNSYTGQTTISQGAIEVAANGALGTPDGGTVVAEGGSLRLAGGFTYGIAEALTLHGNGNPQSDAALLNAGGTNDFDGPITLGSDARVRSASGTLRLRGGIDNAGHQLELAANGRIEIDSAGITGSGSLLKTGGDWLEIGEGGATSDYSGGTTIAGGHVDIRGDDAFGTGPITISAGGSNFLTRNGAEVANQINTTASTVFRHEDGTTSVYSGPVSLGTSATVEVRSSSGTLDIQGQIAGDQAVTKTYSGRLILRQANQMSNFTLAGGTVEIHDDAALGSTTQVGVDAGETLAFHGDMTFDSGDALATVRVDHGTVSSTSGTTTLDIPVQLGPTGNVTFGGAGNLTVMQGFGNGAGPVSSGLLNHYGYDRSGDDRDSLYLHGNGGVMGTPVVSKGRAQVATTGNVDLASPPATVDGVPLAPLSTVLVKDQTDATQNGLYQVPGTEVPLQNATAVFSQAGNWAVTNLIDGVVDNTGSGWANAGNDVYNVAVFETTANLNTAGGTIGLTFQVHNGRHDAHHLGRFRISATTDDRSEFADGLTSGGDVTANWVELAPAWAASSGTSGLAVLSDNSVIMAETASRVPEIFTIQVTTDLQDITGFRLEALEDPSFPQSGPGTAGNGNYTVFEFDVFESSAGPWTRIPGMDEDAEVPGASVMVDGGTSAGKRFRTSGDPVAIGTDDIAWSEYAPDPAQAAHFTGQALLTVGPGERGLNFDSDGDFLATGAIDQNDNYKNLFVGRLHVDAAEAGPWEFRNSDRDDWATMWIDLDRDGVFESTTDGLGSDRGEQLAWNDGGTKRVNLGEGDYLVAFTHLEGGGGSRIEYSFKSPSMASQAVISPADPSQAGLWSALEAVIPDNHVIKEGDGVVTLAGDNTFNGSVSVRAGMLVAAHENAFGLAGGDVTLSNGASLGFSGGVTIHGENITGAEGRGAGQPGTLVNLDGDNAFFGDVAASSGPGFDQEVSVVSQSGTLTIGAPGGGNTIELNLSKLTLDGPGNTVINSDISALSGEIFAEAVAGYVFVNNSYADPGDPRQIQAILTDQSLDLNGDADFNAMFSDLNRNDNYASTFIGDLVIPDRLGGGTPYDVVFRGVRADDANEFWIDLDQDGTLSTSGALGDERIVNVGCCPTNFTATVNLAPGTYGFKLRHREGGGGSDLRPQIDIGDGNGFQFWDPGDMAGGVQLGMTRTATPELVKRGTGTATLAGNNSYTGPTRVVEGMLVAASDHALGTTDAGTTVSSGATLGLEGGVTITGEALTLGAAPGNPGTLRNVSGNNTYAGPVASEIESLGEVRFRSSSAGDVLQVTGDVNLEFSKLLVDGSGDTVVRGVIHGRGADQISPSYSESVLASAPVAYWRLNETSLPTAADSLGLRDGSYENFTAADLGQTDQPLPGQPANTSVLFDTVDQYVSVPHDDAMNALFAGDFTIEFWVKKTSEASDWQRIIGKGDLNGNDQRTLGIWEQSGSGKHLKLQQYADNGAGIDFDSTGEIEVGQWYHVVATMENNTAIFYFNGAFDSSGTRGDGTVRTDASPLTIGENPYRHTTFPGLLDEVAIYDRSLSAAEVLAHYEARETFSVFADNSLYKTGTGTLTLTGDNTYGGTTEVMEGTLLVHGTHTGGGMYTVAPGATLGGSGSTDAPVDLHGAVSPGASVGRFQSGSQTWQDTASYLLEMDDAAGTPGGPSGNGWDMLQIDGTLDLTGLTQGGFEVDLVSVLPGTSTPGEAENFSPDAYSDYAWDFVTATGGILGFDPELFVVDLSGFLNDISNEFGQGRFSVQPNPLDPQHTLQIAFNSAIPEPSTAVLAALGLLGLAVYARRRMRPTA